MLAGFITGSVSCLALVGWVGDCEEANSVIRHLICRWLSSFLAFAPSVVLFFWFSFFLILVVFFGFVGYLPWVETSRSCFCLVSRFSLLYIHSFSYCTTSHLTSSDQ